MGCTKLSIQGDRFLMNGRLTYEEIPHSNKNAHGLLMNARFIQSVFDDASGRERYARFGFECFDPERNTDDLIAALPEWYRYGLRAFTVGLQGGGPCYTILNTTISMNPFGPCGDQFDPAVRGRMERLIEAADRIGMVVIVSCFYGAQALRIENDEGIERAVLTVARWLRQKGYTNVILEIANEFTIDHFQKHPILSGEEGIVHLMQLAKAESGGVPVGCSGEGGGFHPLVVKNSDVILIHGNGQTRQQYFNLIQKCRRENPRAPIVCNEDSQAISQLGVAFHTGTSWGYYNNMTKQEPPARWGVLAGEDSFFALRMAMGIGIPVTIPPEEEQYALCGLEPEMTDCGKRWIRLASLFPESIDYVDFYRNGEWYDTAYDDPFTVRFLCNWWQEGVPNSESPVCWRAEVHRTDGRVIPCEKTIG